MSRRVSPEEVVAAYKATGAKPKQGKWCRKDYCGDVMACGLGVMYYQETHDHNASASEVEAWATQRYGAKYVANFIVGFDCPDFRPEYKLEGDACRGFCDGRAAFYAATGLPDPRVPKEDDDAGGS